MVGILVTAPFYGARKPTGQEAWFLRRVSDAFAQAWAVALEATALLHWARRRWRVPLAVTGVSYGAAMAALTSKLYPGPLAVVPYMGCSGPGEPFAHGTSLSSFRHRLGKGLPVPHLVLIMQVLCAAALPVSSVQMCACNTQLVC